MSDENNRPKEHTDRVFLKQYRRFPKKKSLSVIKDRTWACLARPGVIAPAPVVVVLVELAGEVFLACHVLPCQGIPPGRRGTATFIKYAPDGCA